MLTDGQKKQISEYISSIASLREELQSYQKLSNDIINGASNIDRVNSKCKEINDAYKKYIEWLDRKLSSESAILTGILNGWYERSV